MVSEFAINLYENTDDDTNLKEFDNLVNEYFNGQQPTRMDYICAMRYLIKKIQTRDREINLQKTMHKARVAKLQALIELKR